MSGPGEPTVVIGRYSLHAQIASGGMGVVHYATTDEGGARHVLAAKRLHPHLRHDQSFAMMLLDEARLAVSVRHPNVVQVMDVVSTPTDLLLVMEYVPGVSVHELIAHEGRRSALPLQVAITIAVDGLRGLQAAHEAVGEDGRPLDLVHRDISPQNLLVDASGVTKLTDFGVAKAVGRLRSTRDGSIRGKIAYMSPEQVADSGVDQRADIYSFAVVLWELIAGRPMFEAETDVALFGKAMRGPTERVAEVQPDVPPAVDAAIWRALARDPRRRYPTARAFADALVDAFGAVDHTWVASYLRERAGTLLQKRQGIVHDLLRADLLAMENADTVTVSGPIDVTNLPVMIDAPPTPTELHAPALQKSRRVQMAMLGVASAAVAVAVFMLASSHHAEPEPQFPPPPPLTQPEPTPAVVAPVATPAASVVPPPASTAKVSAAPLPPKPRAAAPKRPEKDPKADCNPPYTEDETGKHFKPWCLR